jgi:hypothetical protein
VWLALTGHDLVCLRKTSAFPLFYPPSTDSSILLPFHRALLAVGSILPPCFRMTIRLLNVHTLELRKFTGLIPVYTILSHTWEDEEVTLQEIINIGPATDARKGSRRSQTSAWRRLLGVSTGDGLIRVALIRRMWANYHRLSTRCLHGTAIRRSALSTYQTFTCGDMATSGIMRS